MNNQTVTFREHPDRIVVRTFELPAANLSNFKDGFVDVEYHNAFGKSRKETVAVHPEDIRVVALAVGPSPEFSPGEIVRLKSGSPAMTIRRFHAGNGVDCIWFDGGAQVEGSFWPNEIELYNKS